MKLSTQIVLLETYSAIADLTFGDLYGHIKTENALFLLYFPEAMLNKLKHGTKQRFCQKKQLSFYLKLINACFYSKVVIVSKLH